MFILSHLLIITVYASFSANDYVVSRVKHKRGDNASGGGMIIGDVGGISKDTFKVS